MIGAGDRVEHRCARGAHCADRERLTQRPTVCDQCECHEHGAGHPCTVQGGCGHLHPETTTWVGTRIAAPHGVCHICASHIGHAIGHLPLDVAELTVLMAATGAAAGDKVRSTPTPPIPIRVGVEALRAEIDHEVQCWVEPVAERLGIVWDTGGAHRSRLGHRVQHGARLLSRAVPTLLGLPVQEHPAWSDGEPVFDSDGCQDTVCRDGIAGALYLVELHRRVFVSAGRSRLVHRLGAPCCWCGQRTLTRENGASVVRCESVVCRGRAVPERHYDWLVAVVAAEEKRQRKAAA